MNVYKQVYNAREDAYNKVQKDIPGVTTWNGSPVWAVVPVVIGERYIDLDWPTVYTAYWLTNADRIS